MFERVGSNWVETKLVASMSVGTLIDRPVAIEGNRIAVGAPGLALGRVYLFEEAGTWTEVDAVSSGDGSFGSTVELELGRLVVGAHQANFGVGRAFVYEPKVSGWELQAVLRSKVNYNQLTTTLSAAGEWVVAGTGTGSRAVLWMLDCDGNLVVDGTDLLNGAPDCDGDTFLDVCEIASGSLDANQDGVPDECQTLNFPYCVGKVNSSLCLPAVTFTGTPSLSDPSPFDLTASDVLASKNGLLFYGLSGPASAPFLGGTLCVNPPLARTPIQSSGAGAACEGVLLFDFNAWLQGGNDPLVQAATTVNAQYWYRDPGSLPFGVGLSNAVEFVVGP